MGIDKVSYSSQLHYLLRRCTFTLLGFLARSLDLVICHSTIESSQDLYAEISGGAFFQMSTFRGQEVAVLILNIASGVSGCQLSSEN